MLTAQITIPQWLQIPLEIRAKLVEIFKIPRSSGTVVQDNTVLTDGYTHDDLAKLTVEILQQYTNSEEKEFFKLINLVIENLSEKEKQRLLEQEALRTKLQEEELDEYQAQVVDTVKTLGDIAETVMKRRGRPPKTT